MPRQVCLPFCFCAKGMDSGDTLKILLSFVPRDIRNPHTPLQRTDARLGGWQHGYAVAASLLCSARKKMHLNYPSRGVRWTWLGLTNDGCTSTTTRCPAAGCTHVFGVPGVRSFLHQYFLTLPHRKPQGADLVSSGSAAQKSRFPSPMRQGYRCRLAIPCREGNLHRLA